MQIETVDLRKAIADGLIEAVHKQFYMLGEHGEEPRPEYLTTAAVAFTLADFAWHNDLHGEMKVRCEPMTGDVWRKGHIRTRLSDLDHWRQQPAPKVESDDRKGNVDISLYMGSSFEESFGVIENKGLLSFTKKGDLYGSSRSEVEKDLLRNIEFVLGSLGQGGVEYSAFTFFLKDDTSRLKEEGEDFCRRHRQFFESMVREILTSRDPNGILRTNVTVDTADDGFYESSDAALAVDEDGAPAQDMHPPWHIAYGIVSVYRLGKFLTDKRSLPASLATSI